MKKIITALAGATCLLCAATSHAGVYKFDFTASDFQPSYEVFTPAPQDSVTGWFTFTADSLGAPVTSINGVNLTINGHKYTAEEIGALIYGYNQTPYAFGGTAVAINGYRWGTDDFYISNGYMTYTVAGVLGSWYSFKFTSTYSELAAEVPEPGSLALMLAGVGGLAALRRRRRM